MNLLARFLIFASLSLSLVRPAVAEQARERQKDDAYTLTTQTNVVLVPVTVRTKQGEMIYALKSNQFVVEDNGVPQKIRLDEDTDALGLTMVVLVQCSRAAVMEYAKLSGLSTMLEAVAGGAPKQVAVAAYGKEATLLGDFSSVSEETAGALSQLQPCDDSEAATFDAVYWATDLLNQRKDHNRHAILLISEARDHGSQKKPADVIAELGRSNTVVDSVSFSPGKTEMLSGLKFGGGPGPLGLLAMAVNAAKKNAPKTLSALSGGEYMNFTTQKDFDNGLHQISNRIHNYYLLSFQPQAGTNGVLQMDYIVFACVCLIIQMLRSAPERVISVGRSIEQLMFHRSRWIT
jgi:VWFA-related protein